MTKTKRMTKTTRSEQGSPEMQLSLRPRQLIQKRRSQPAGVRAPGRKGYGLASARDRDRLRERNRSERARVEKMFSTSPGPDDRRNQNRDLQVQNHDWTPSALGGPIGLPSRRPAYCPVCGDHRTATDEVVHAGTHSGTRSGTLSMSECLHCDHRWTGRAGATRVDLGSPMNRGGRFQSAATTTA